MDKKLSFETHISWEDFKKFNFYALYGQPVGMFSLFIGAIMWFALGFYFMQDAPSKKFPAFQVGIALATTVLIPLFTYWNAKRNYQINSRAIERMQYEIDEEWISIKGDTFDSRMTWDKMHKVIETKSWFLIYQNKVAANIIVKKDLTTEQLATFRAIVRNVADLEAKLR